MLVNSSEIVQSFKPIRVDITVQTAQDMDDMAAVLRHARAALQAFRGPEATRRTRLIEQLLPAFERV